MKQVVIMRGPSGSGKSTYIKTYLDKGHVISADHYFIYLNPESGEKEYRFNPMKLPVAHSSCMRNFVASLVADMPLVVVDNTNIHNWEYDSYIDIAIAFNYCVQVVQFVPDTIDGLRKCIRRNSHGVPSDVLARMFIEFEECRRDDVEIESFPI